MDIACGRLLTVSMSTVDEIKRDIDAMAVLRDDLVVLSRVAGPFEESDRHGDKNKCL